MKAIKLTVLVLDFEDYGEENAKDNIESMKYLMASVVDSESVDIGEWDDDHPLNNSDTSEAEFNRLFNEK